MINKNFSCLHIIQKMQNLSQNGLKQIARKKNLSQNDLGQITKMLNLSRSERKAKMRCTRNYKNMSKEGLLIALSKSGQNFAELHKSNSDNGEIEKN